MYATGNFVLYWKVLLGFRIPNSKNFCLGETFRRMLSALLFFLPHGNVFTQESVWSPEEFYNKSLIVADKMFCMHPFMGRVRRRRNYKTKGVNEHFSCYTSVSTQT